MDITVDTDERPAMTKWTPRIRLPWTLMAVLSGLSLMMATALTQRPAGPVTSRESVLPGVTGLAYSPRSEAFAAPRPQLAATLSAPLSPPAHDVVPTPKPVFVAVAVAHAPRPASRPAVPRATPQQALTPALPPALSPARTGEVRMSMLDEGYDETSARPQPIAMATSVLVGVATAPLTALSLGRDAIVRATGRR